jgi:hypothetical protein
VKNAQLVAVKGNKKLWVNAQGEKHEWWGISTHDTEGKMVGSPHVGSRKYVEGLWKQIVSRSGK